jgi:hypothetical protein
MLTKNIACFCQTLYAIKWATRFEHMSNELITRMIVTYTQSLIHSAANSIKYAESYAEDAQITIILSALAVESFLNELANLNKYSPQEELSIPLQLAASVLSELEENNAQIKLKVMMSHYALTGNMIDKGAQPYQDFELLVNLRNALVHPKPIITDGELHKFVKQLVSRKVIKSPQNEQMETWRKSVLQPSVARWAYSTATSIILDLIDKIPGTLEKAFFGIIEMSITGAEAYLKKYDTEELPPI